MYKPTLEQATNLAKKDNFIPLSCEFMADSYTALSIFSALAYDKDNKPIPHSFLLESASSNQTVGRYTFLAINYSHLIKQEGQETFLYDKENNKQKLEGDNIYHKIEQFLSKYKVSKFNYLPPFSGGAVGYCSFETIEELEPSVICNQENSLNCPMAIFSICDTIIAFDNFHNKIQLISHIDLTNTKSPTKEYIQEAYETAKNNLTTLYQQLTTKVKLLNLTSLEPYTEEIQYTSNITKDTFLENVTKAKDYIKQGDIIQVVLSQRFETENKVSPITIHRTLRSLNPSPYMFCLHYDDFSLVGSSPELHASCKNDNLTIRPIAGTRKRGYSTQEDNQLAESLKNDEKEIAEHIMLVDLARNDLSRVAEDGTVEVNDLMHIEKYSHVMHLVSNVEAKLSKTKNVSDVLKASFPAGTVSGAPKIRAMQIISELETSQRGCYAGVISYFSFDSSLDSCIAIRTIVLKDNKAYVQAGAGIVADSNPIKEYEETQNKAKALLIAIKQAQLL